MPLRAALKHALGIPANPAERTHAIATLVEGRDPQNAAEFIFTVMSHNTGKAGALLAAQGMFAVVGTYGMEHDWPRALVVSSMLLLMLGALLAMSILRSTLGVFGKDAGRSHLEAVFDLTVHRVIRLNIAMYMTFVSVLLLIGATLVQA